ncbi:MAG: WbqC family protein [Elusimicrobia bacterium]|nr:WbqC family protein [Elusimicrobiota bacterium]
MKTIVVMQPTYLPWLGYFDLMRNSDAFVIYDCAQFAKRSWQQRNRIRNMNGEIMLTVPVISKGRYNQSIKDVKIDHLSSIKLTNHLDTIRFSYARSLNFSQLFPSLERIYSKGHDSLLGLNMDLIELGRERLGIKTEIIFASSLDVQGGQVPALIDICKKLGGNRYLSPVGSKVYIDANNLFPGAAIDLKYQEFHHPRYPQAGCTDFISHLAFIDYLFNVTAPGF